MKVLLHIKPARDVAGVITMRTIVRMTAGLSNGLLIFLHGRDRGNVMARKMIHSDHTRDDHEAADQTLNRRDFVVQE